MTAWRRQPDEAIENLLNNDKQLLLTGICCIKYFYYYNEIKKGAKSYADFGCNIKYVETIDGVNEFKYVDENGNMIAFQPEKGKDFILTYSKPSLINLSDSILIETHSRTKDYFKKIKELKTPVKTSKTAQGKMTEINSGGTNSKAMLHMMAIYCEFDNYSDFNKTQFEVKENMETFSAIKNFIDNKKRKEKSKRLGPIEDDEDKYDLLDLYDYAYRCIYLPYINSGTICFYTILDLLERFNFDVNRFFGVSDEEVKPTIRDLTHYHTSNLITNNLVDHSVFRKLEKEKAKGLTIKAITSNLEWCSYYIHNIAELIVEKGHFYKYIVTNYDADSKLLKNIKDVYNTLTDEQKAHLQILNLKHHFCSLYFDTSKVYPMEFDKYKKIDAFTLNSLKDSYLMLRSTMFLPYDIIIHGNLPLDDKEIAEINDKNFFIVKEQNETPAYMASMGLTPLNYKINKGLSAKDALIEQGITIKINEWFDNIWELFDKEVSTNNRGEFFLLEAKT